MRKNVTPLPATAGAATDPRQAPSYYVKRLAQEMSRLADAELRPLGVGMASLPVLTALKQGHASTQAELARYLHVEQPSMAQMLGRLERDGFIRRQAHALNKRIQLIAITAEAEAILPRSKEILSRGNDRALAGFTAEEISTVLGLLKRMHDNLSGEIGETAK